MVYTFEQIHAVDPNNPAVVASNGAVTIFTPGDLTLTPVEIFTPDGLPLANPVIVNAQGYGPAFIHQTLDRVAWTGGGFSGYFTSYDGMKGEAVAARSAAEAAAAAAEGSSQAAIDAINLVSAPSGEVVTQVLSDPQSPARAILDEAYALKGEAGTGSGAQWIEEDPNDPGIFNLLDNAPLIPDPDNEGFFKIAGM